MDKLKIGISIGDINGIGLEVVLKTFANREICNHCTPIIYGSSKILSYHKNIIESDVQYHQTRSLDQIHDNKVNVLNCWQENVNITLGKPTEISGRFAALSLDAATNDMRDGKLDALVTAPINKEAMQMTDFPFPGHTEYLTRELSDGESLMLMISDRLRVGLVTNHLPIDSVTPTITKELILRKLSLMEESLRMDFGLERPTIAVLGLNPHAGDGGVIGDEDERIVRPAVLELKKEGHLVMGPFPADGFFGMDQHRKYDGVMAMYHDQGLIPFKLLSFGRGVNFTAGLIGVRTSPDHGTAYDIAGKNQADPSSFRQALFSAIDIARNRKMYQEMHADALQKRRRLRHDEEE